MNKEKTIERELSLITVQIRRNDNIIGTGILYYNNNLGDKVYILTARHCLFDTKDKFRDINIGLYNPKNNKYQFIPAGKIISSEKNEDMAVIILEKRIIDPINSDLYKIQVINNRKSFESFFIKGFSMATNMDELVLIPCTWLQEMINESCFQLQIESDYIVNNISGASGSGVFLRNNDNVYLLGILTRFRAEEKGRVVYCQYIDSINKILRKNYLPLISYSYLGEHNLTQHFFKQQVEQQVKNLGDRFNENLNLKLSISQKFNSLTKNSVYCQTLISNISDWLKNIRLNKNEYFNDIKKEFDELQKETKNWLINFQDDYSFDKEITVIPIVEKIREFDKKIEDKWFKINNLTWNHKKEKDKTISNFDSELSNLRELRKRNRIFFENIDQMNIALANHPILIIKGDAGSGKSHLLGDIATERIMLELPTILLLGTTFENTTIEKNIIDKIDFKGNFEDLLKGLNDIGLQINSRVLMLIDAINEGAGVDLWKNQIAGFVNRISKFTGIALVMTIRSTYFQDIIPETFSNVTILEHRGFMGNEIEALRLFCEYYKLQFPNFPILSSEFTNPLFLQIICKTVKELPNKSFPKGFQAINDVYNSYKKSLDKKFEEKREEYKFQNIVSKVIEKLALKFFSTEYFSLKVYEVIDFLKLEFSSYKLLFLDLIEENILIKTKSDLESEDIIYFSYQKLGDFFLAERLLKSYSTKEEVLKAFEKDSLLGEVISDYERSKRGIVEMFAILLPEKFDLELFELIDVFISKNRYINDRNEQYIKKHINADVTRILLDSLKWRKTEYINNDKITKWLQERAIIVDEYYCWLILTELAAIPNHPFNSNRLYEILSRFSMAERDAFLQNYIRFYNGYDDNGVPFPMRRLIDWAWSFDISLHQVDTEIVYLVAQTLVWFLSSTNNTVRDQVTKSLVNLLEQQAEILIRILKTFKKVSDWYILDRLYAVTYGCILRTEEKESIQKIAQYIYDITFKNGEPPLHILIRDYARNTIEYAISKKIELNIDIRKILPPYDTKFNYKPLSNDELDKKYKPKDKSGNWRNENWGITAILKSMVTEYGRGIGMYGDFGRYVFQREISNFELPKKLNIDLLSNLAVEWIFEKYGYNTKLHGEYDSSIVALASNIEERIGKKYQWIALHQILAIVSDNCKMNSRYSDTENRYQGAWQLDVRDIDPAYITKDKKESEVKTTSQDYNKWWNDIEYSYWDTSDSKWKESLDDLIDPQQIIQKKDKEDQEWLYLQHSTKWKEPEVFKIAEDEKRRREICYLIQGLLVKKKDKQEIINYLKEKRFWGRWLPENKDDYSSLINREKFWSPAYKEQYAENIWKTIDNTKYEVIVSTESAKGIFDRDSSGANQPYNIPCRYIFEGMKLKYTTFDCGLSLDEGKTIVINTKPDSVLIRKKELINFLDQNDLDIIWTLVGEKFLYIKNKQEEWYLAELEGLFYLEENNVKKEFFKLYNRE
jgi:hypothetical protein